MNIRKTDWQEAESAAKSRSQRVPVGELSHTVRPVCDRSCCVSRLGRASEIRRICQEDMGNETKRRNRNETKRKTTETKRNGIGKNTGNGKLQKYSGNETKRLYAKKRYEPETK